MEGKIHKKNKFFLMKAIILTFTIKLESAPHCSKKKNYYFGQCFCVCDDVVDDNNSNDDDAVSTRKVNGDGDDDNNVNGNDDDGDGNGVNGDGDGDGVCVSR